MKYSTRYVFIVFILSALVWLTGCERDLSGAERDTVLASSQAVTDNLFAGYNANDYEAFSRNFDAAMRREIPAAQFAALKQELDNKIGSYVSRTVDRVARSDELYVVTYRARFEQADPVKVTVVFHSSDARLIGLVGFESEQASWSAFQQDGCCTVH